jgi:hypothetical protein
MKPVGMTGGRAKPAKTSAKKTAKKTAKKR